jgi:hypothetical protein
MGLAVRGRGGDSLASAAYAARLPLDDNDTLLSHPLLNL